MVISSPDELLSAMPNRTIIDKKNRHNEDYCRRLVNDKVLVTRVEYIPECRKTRSSKTTYRKNVIWDYPAVAITSYDANGKYTCSNYSRAAYATSYNVVLTKRLNSLERNKQIGDKRYKNIIGHCAEPHAANQTMNAYAKAKHSNMPLAGVFFSLALRPRTLEVIPTCQNCKDTFPNLR